VDRYAHQAPLYDLTGTRSREYLVGVVNHTLGRFEALVLRIRSDGPCPGCPRDKESVGRDPRIVLGGTVRSIRLPHGSPRWGALRHTAGRNI
jgi:hypothetical protein